VHLAQGFADGALDGELALLMIRKAGVEDDGAIDGADDLEGGDAGGGAGQAVAAVGALLGGQEALAGELLEDLGEDGHGNAVELGHLLGARGGRAGGAGAAMEGEVAEADEAVVRFFGQFEHAADLGPFRSHIQGSTGSGERQRGGVHFFVSDLNCDWKGPRCV